MGSTKRIIAALFASLLLHALTLILAMPSWLNYREARLFRARLSYQSRYVAPVSRRIPPERDTSTELTYLPSLMEPEAAPLEVSPCLSAPLDSAPSAAPSLSTFEPGQRPSEGFAAALGDTAAPLVTGDTPLNRQDMQTRFEQRRLSDIARAGTDRAAILVDSSTRRGIRGFVHLSELRMNGIRDFDLAVPRLARFLTHVTDIEAQLEGPFVSSFHQAQLQKTPILFVFPGEWGRLQPHMAADEVEALGEYLRSGGFLFVEAGLDTALRPPEITLRPLIGHIRDALAPDGQLVVVPPGHPLYHSFYDFPDGFSGNASHTDSCGLGSSWQYHPEPTGSVSARLWGVQLDGYLVAPLSELGLHNSWGPPANPAYVRDVLGEAGRALPPGELALRAGVNVIV